MGVYLNVRYGTYLNKYVGGVVSKYAQPHPGMHKRGGG